MEAPKVTIASLDINADKLIKELKSTKEGIAEIIKENKELEKVGKGTSEAFIRNEANIKSLRSEYGKQIKQLNAVTDGNVRLNEELKKEINTVDDAISNNKELRLIRNQVNANTKEGAEAIAEINAKLDENTEFVKSNGSALEKLKMNVGNYKEDIKGAASDLNIFNGGLGGFIAKSQEAGGAGKFLGNSFKTMGNGILGVTKASLAFIATPLGAVLAAIVGAFALVKNALNRSEDSTNSLKRAFSAFSGLMKGVLKILEPIGEFLIDGLVKGMELAEKAIYKALDGISTALDFLGFEDAAKSVKGFNEEIQESAKQSKLLADAEANLEKETRKARITQLEYQKDAEKLRQLRDDENLTIAQRIKANEDLGSVLEKQLAEELRIAQAALTVANIRIQTDGQTKEALDSQAEALTEIADIQERLAGQESEQLVNRVSLQKEAADKAKEIADKAIEDQKTQLDLYIAQQGTRAKTLEEDLKLAQEVSKRRIDILDEELRQRNITQTEYDLAYLNIKTELLDKQTDISIDNAQRELKSYIDANMSKLDSDKFLTQEALNEEENRLDAIAQKRREFAEKQLEEGVINQTELNDTLKEIDEENYLAKQEIELERKEAKTQAELLDFENQLALDRERLETDLALNLEYLNREREAALKDAEKTGADKAKIEAQFGEYEIAIRSEVAANKVALASDTLGNLVNILGKESAAGKAVAVAQATIDTYASAVSAFNSLSGIPIVGPILGGIAAAAAVASGIATVSKIVSTPKPTIPKAARGMMIGGRKHSAGGTLIEAERGEAIINAKSTSKYGSLLSAINSDGGNGIPFMAQGGINGSTSFSNNSIIDYDLLANRVADANRSLPAPTVSVEEFNSVQKRVSIAEQSVEL